MIAAISSSDCRDSSELTYTVAIKNQANTASMSKNRRTIHAGAASATLGTNLYLFSIATVANSPVLNGMATFNKRHMAKTP